MSANRAVQDSVFGFPLVHRDFNMTPSPNNIPLPSERNLRIFQQVVVDGQSREQVAGEFGLSRGHVGHIVREVRRQLEQQRAKADPKWVV